MEKKCLFADFVKGKDGKLNILLSAFFLAAVIMGAYVAIGNMEFDAAYAKAKYAGAHKATASITRINQQPWLVKSDGRALAIVKDKETGDLVELGLRIKYCDSIKMQQDATVKNIVTVERAPMAAYRQSEVLTAPQAVEKIDKMNQAADRAAEEAVEEETASEEAQTAAENESSPSSDTADAVSPAEEAPITVSINQVVEEDKTVKRKVKIIETDELVRGEQKVTEAGRDGTKHVVKDVVMENGEYAGSKVLDQEVTDEAVTKVIYEGTKLSTRDKGELLVQYATRFLGTKYVWGGTDLREGTDCSGYTMRLYEKVGITIPRTSYSQENIGEEVEYEDAQPGDLVLYPGHVGIYMGDNKMIHATDNFVKITDDCRYRKVLCIRRIFTDEDNVTQETFDELFKEEYNEGAEEIAKEKLAELKYETMTDEFISKYLNSDSGSDSNQSGDSQTSDNEPDQNSSDN